MPLPGKAWFHIIFNTRGSWLPGDPRGFRSRNHRKHSEGDYMNPPPVGQHAGLHRVVREQSGPAVSIPPGLFGVIGQAVLDKCEQQGHRVLAAAVDEHHVHLLVELPVDRKLVKQLVGAWKQKASHQVRDRLPGSIWSKSCNPVLIKGRAHHERVFAYILEHGQKGAWVWSFRQGDRAYEKQGA